MRILKILRDSNDTVNETHKRILLFVECKSIHRGFCALDKPTRETADALPFGENLNVEMLLAKDPARIKNDLYNFSAATIVFARQ